MEDKQEIQYPLLLTFISKITGSNTHEFFVENSMYNTSYFNRIPFYKPTSLISSDESLISTLNTPNHVSE